MGGGVMVGGVDGLPPLTYLTFDALSEGVGASQVLPYVLRLAGRGLQVRLISFEKQPPGPDLARDLATAGVRWDPQPFRRYGPRSGALRVLRAAALVRGSALVHARSDLAAAAAMLAGVRSWVWDLRSLWADQRIALGT